MARSWSDLEARLKRIEEKKAQDGVEETTGGVFFPEKPKKQPEKGEFTKYLERVQRAYTQSARQETVVRDRYSSMADELRKPELADERGDKIKEHFKGMEKRFLKPR